MRLALRTVHEPPDLVGAPEVWCGVEVCRARELRCRGCGGYRSVGATYSVGLCGLLGAPVTSPAGQAGGGGGGGGGGRKEFLLTAYLITTINNIERERERERETAPSPQTSCSSWRVWILKSMRFPPASPTSAPLAAPPLPRGSSLSSSTVERQAPVCIRGLQGRKGYIGRRTKLMAKLTASGLLFRSFMKLSSSASPPPTLST
jgi:hypothetical protein